MNKSSAEGMPPPVRGAILFLFGPFHRLKLWRGLDGWVFNVFPLGKQRHMICTDGVVEGLAFDIIPSKSTVITNSTILPSRDIDSL